MQRLQALHKDLLQARRQDGDTDDVFDRAEALIRRGQVTGALLDSEEDRGTAQAILDYWSAILFKAGRQPPDATLAEFDPDLAPEIPDALCPYVGLDPFREAKRDVFFGRERMVTSLLERLKDDRLLVVVGPSGCGKSSIVLAGLLPALKNGALPDSQNWRYAPADGARLQSFGQPGARHVGDAGGGNQRSRGMGTRAGGGAAPRPATPGRIGEQSERNAHRRGRRPVRGGLHPVQRRWDTPCLPR